MPLTDATQDGLPWPQRLWAILTLLLSVVMATLDTAIANTALPTMAAELGATPADSIWIVTAYQLAMMAALLPLAALGEIVGYRRLSIAGIVLFTAASLACALAWSLPALVAARFVQGLGAAGIMSVNAAILRFVYPRHALGRGLGLNAMVVAVGFAVGPTVASGVLSVAGWPWLFAINVPIGIGAIALALWALPHTPRATHRFDAGGAVLSALCFGLLILAIGEGAHQAPLHWVAFELLGALAAGGWLLHRQRAHPAPMLPVDLFRRPVFALSSLTSICTFAAQGLAFVALPFFLHHDLGRSQVDVGLLLTPWSVLVALAAPVAGRLSDRFPAAILGGTGLVVLCVGLLCLAWIPANPSTLDIVWRMALCGAGFGFFQSPNLRALMSAAPPERSGAASGVIATSRLLGQSIGASLVALCFVLSATRGTTFALLLGAAFALAASVASFSRLLPAPVEP